MTCQFKAYARIDIEGVGSLLKSTEGSREQGVTYDDSSGPASYQDGRETSFLNECHVSLSPGGEFMVFAHRKNLCILSAKWDSREEDDVKTKFKTTWEGNPCHSQSEEITAVICLPLIMPNKSSRAVHSSEQIDWTCIAVGFNSGFVRFYDEGGNLLLSEQIYSEPVLYLKCQSCHPFKNSNYDDYSEELYAIFRSTVAIIPGFALFQTLRACRNQVARVKANFAEHTTPPPLTLKKWTFVDQDRLRDCEVIGPSSSDMFDHLMTASIRGGFQAAYRSGAPKSTLVLAAGKGPFVGFHHAMEGVEGRSVLTDVAQVVKSKFKGFFFSSGNDRQKTAATIEPPENLACRFGICDFNREADHVVRSPNREYSAVTDKLGRVTLVNNLRGVAVHMWKGYRKAQCGWLQVEEEEPTIKGTPKHLLRSVLFLVIYDPRKGMLEVWTVPDGVRIAAFSCSKMGRLLYTGHGLFGLNNGAVNWANKSVFPCVFLDLTGTAFQIIVPFHCALSDATSERAADLALLRKLKSVLQEDDLEGEQLAQEVGLLAAELKTTEVRKKMLSMLTCNRHVTVDALETALAVFIDRAFAEEAVMHVVDSKGCRESLLLSSQQLRNLLSFYKFVQQQREKPPNYSSVVPQEGISDLQAVCDVLSVSDSEASALKSLMSLIDSPVSSHSTPRKEARVTFNENTSRGSVLVNYLYCFDVGKKVSGNVASNSVAIKTSSTKTAFLAELLFQGILYSEVPIDVWQAEAACSSILPSNLLQLAIEYWLHRNAGKSLEVEMIRFAEIIKAICLLEEVNSCDLSSFWSLVRSLLANSHQPFNALTAALVCRAVACSLEKQSLKKHSKSPKKSQSSISKHKDSEILQSSNNDACVSNDPNDPSTSGGILNQTECRKTSSEWVDVSWDSVEWNMLIGRLEDIALLDQVLGQNPTEICDLSTKPLLPCVPYEKPLISLTDVLQKGKGTISELVARWLVTCGLHPIRLIESSDIERSEKYTGTAKGPSPMDVDEPEPEPGPEDKSEVMVREGVPLTTEEGTEASLVCASHAQILDKIYLLRKHFPYSLCGSTLISNLTWEYLLQWQKNPDCLDFLNAAMTCLRIIPNVHVRQGLSSLMWSSHIKQRFENFTRVINDSAGIPKEKLCCTELQMSDYQLVNFVETFMEFIDIFLEASNMGEVIHRPGHSAVVNRCEDMWDYDEPAPVKCTPSLISLALDQPQALFDQLHLLYQLALVLHFILALDLRGQKLRQLFKPSDWAIFFSDNSNSALKITQASDDHLLTHKRTQFLISCVTSAMQSVCFSDPQILKEWCGGHKLDVSGPMEWFGKCLGLAYTWNIDVDPIRRHQVFLLYSFGHDRIAEEVLPAVTNVDALAEQLLVVCGQRLKLQIVNNVPSLGQQMSNILPNITPIVLDLNTVGVREASIKDSVLLTTHVVRLLPEDHPEHVYAENLLEAWEALDAEGC